MLHCLFACQSRQLSESVSCTDRGGSLASMESVSFTPHHPERAFLHSIVHNHPNLLDSLGMGVHIMCAGCKHTNFELATHAPLIIRVPGLTDGGIRECDDRHLVK